MEVLKFIWYCIKCVGDLLSASLGSVPNDYSWKVGLVGAITLIVIIAIGFIILLATGVIEFKKKSDKDKEGKK